MGSHTFLLSAPAMALTPDQNAFEEEPRSTMHIGCKRLTNRQNFLPLAISPGLLAGFNINWNNQGIFVGNYNLGTLFNSGN